MKTIIDGKSLNIQSLKKIGTGEKLSIPATVKGRMAKSEKVVRNIVKKDNPSYGINTGFGFLANTKITGSELAELQVNLLKSHACGWGKPLSIEETRVAMALRLNVLTKGLTGVRFAVAKALFDLIENEIYPVIPEYGSVGASGDLAPLAHLALPIIGLGKVHYQGKVVTAASALKKAGLKPLKLIEKEGLGLINGTQVMLSVGGLSVAEALRLLTLADRVAALTYEGMCARVDALDPRIHEARGQKGQIASAKAILHELAGSYLKKTKAAKVQDPYSLRCAPQVHGACRDSIEHAATIVERELNGATDNPLVFEDAIISGGNFHGEPIAMAFDIASIGVAELGNISERRLELLLNPHMSGLSPFLAEKSGVHCGYMVFQYLSASLVNENKLLANPASVDSIPGNVGVEDHVSMGMTSARKLRQAVGNCYAILAVEAMSAAQAIDMRKAGPLGKGTSELYKAIRKKIPMLKADRILTEDVEEIVRLFKELP